MSARDDLAALINDTEDQWAWEEGDGSVEAMAGAILAAGWRPPARTVTTAAELDALPKGTVVLVTGTREAWQKSFGEWWPPASEHSWSAQNVIKEPGRLVVLWEPEVER